MTEEEVQALEAEVSAQGQAVAAAKAVSALFHTHGKLACFAVPYIYACVARQSPRTSSVLFKASCSVVISMQRGKLHLGGEWSSLLEVDGSMCTYHLPLKSRAL